MIDEEHKEEIDYIKEINDKNFMFLTLLGYGMSLMRSLKKELDNHIDLNEYDKLAYDWYFQAIDNLVYKKIPPPPMP